MRLCDAAKPVSGHDRHSVSGRKVANFIARSKLLHLDSNIRPHPSIFLEGSWSKDVSSASLRVSRLSAKSSAQVSIRSRLHAYSAIVHCEGLLLASLTSCYDKVLVGSQVAVSPLALVFLIVCLLSLFHAYLIPHC